MISMVLIRDAELSVSATIQDLTRPLVGVAIYDCEICEFYHNTFRQLSNYIEWQIYRRESVKFGSNLEHIINFTGLRIISIYPQFES